MVVTVYSRQAKALTQRGKDADQGKPLLASIALLNDNDTNVSYAKRAVSGLSGIAHLNFQRKNPYMNGAEIVFDGLAKYYGSSTALEDFSLEVRPGEFMTLLGPSGSGKTTALNCLAGFIDPDRGELRVAGKNILDLSPERRQLGMVFQSYTLFPHMSVYDNVAFPLRLRKMHSADIRKKVDAVLDMVQLSEFASRMPSALSGGQQQRVAFARAVVFEPPVLLMDEPLSALDLKLRKSMQLEIKQYHAELGCNIIFVTHDQKVALVLSDRVAIMSDGMIRQVD